MGRKTLKNTRHAGNFTTIILFLLKIPTILHLSEIIPEKDQYGLNIGK